jgi:hypothetical protein
MPPFLSSPATWLCEYSFETHHPELLNSLHRSGIVMLSCLSALLSLCQPKMQMRQSPLALL